MDSLTLLKQGIYATPTVPNGQLLTLYSKLYPVTIDRQLVRLGASGDGGYLLPDDLTGVDYCYSPGTGPTTSFEASVYEHFNVRSHLADPTVGQPEPAPYIASFLAKFIGPYSSQDTISIEDWIVSTGEGKNETDLIAQIDIEGSEYLALYTLPTPILKRFRIIIIELHEIYNWSNPVRYTLVHSFLERLTKYFNVVHAHANNNDGELELPIGLCPRTIELTLYRKDRHRIRDIFVSLPHRLDALNNPQKPHIDVPHIWRPSTEQHD